MKNFRVERDSLGDVKIPSDALWGPGTQRALENRVSRYEFHREFLVNLALIKKYAGLVNAELGLIDNEMGKAISEASDEIINGNHISHFPLDIFQTGSGTSINMNMNEVIANLASRILKKKVHPNDHVNLCQSSNDVVKSAFLITIRLELEKLLNALNEFGTILKIKSEEFSDVIKVGRTHLMDAVPITLGMEFSAFREQIELCTEEIKGKFAELEMIPLGGTVLGTGINSHPEFGEKVIDRISGHTGIPFRPASSKFYSIATNDTLVGIMASLNRTAISMMKISNDIRLMASGPHAGLGEIKLPEIQPGSSIMAGKVNPVIPEIMIQVCAYVMGNSTAVSIAGQSGLLDLHVMTPFTGFIILESIQILRNSIDLMNKKCVSGIRANRERCRELVEKSLMIATPLAGIIGYDRTAEVVKKAERTGKRIIDVVVEDGLMSREDAERLLNPEKMLKPGIFRGSQI